MDKTVGVNEIAAKLSVKPATVHEWRKLEHLMFPEPAGHKSGTPYWYLDDIKDWLTKRM